jgi:hypothetical protein
MIELLAFVIKSRNVKDLIRRYLRKKNYSCLHVYTFNSINDFMTFRHKFKALGVLEPFKEFYLV